eukprot:m.266332 g.266332  ORF g.266332 m.266332 type:complete len:258 (+) comp16239_c0_seq29:194-967(+)
MDWFLCNTCHDPFSSSANFQLTSCGHIFCGRCLTKSTRETGQQYCPECQSLTSTLKIAKDMPRCRDLFEKSSTQLQEATKIENFRGQQRSMAIKALFQENKKLKARIQELESANIRSDNPRHQQALNHSITPTRRNSTSVGNQFMRGSYETPQFNRSRELTNPGSARSRRSSTTPNRITLARSPADGTLIKRRGKSPMHDKEPQNERTKYRGDFRTPLMTGSRNDLETPSQGRTQGISASRPGRQIIMMSRQIRHSK